MEDLVFEDMIDAIRNSDPERLEEMLSTDKNLWKHLTTFVQKDQEFQGQTLLHIAADSSRNKCVRVILSQVNSRDRRIQLCNTVENNSYGRIPLHTVLDGGCRCDNCTAKNVDCVTVLLEEGSNVNAMDKDGDTPLFYAAEFMMADCASILLEYGADASLQFIPSKDRKKGSTGKKIKLYKYIAQKIPSALTALLEKGITPSDSDSSVLNLDFKVFLQAQEKEDLDGTSQVIISGRETEILVCMAKAHSAGRELLLTHPMTLTFLHFKWSLVRRFSLFIQLSYFVMTAIYTLYVLEAFDNVLPDDDEGNDDPDNETTIASSASDDNDDNGGVKILTKVLVYFVCMWWLFMVLNEFYEISLSLRKYVRVGLNYAWWVLIICVGISVPPGFGVEPELWQLPIAAFSIFLAWGLTLVQTSRFPALGIYIEMLGKVVTDFAIFLVTFAALLIGFALAFHVLFPKDIMFSNLATAFVKVILIMIGETDYESTFEDVVDEDIDVMPLEYTIPAHLMFVGFIFVITIVLMNLLLGLAVSDIQELRKVATVLRVKRQIEQIQLFESLILGRFLPSWISKWGIRHFSIMKILERYDLESSTSLLICPSDPEEKTLPKYLKERFISHVLQVESACINPETIITADNSVLEQSETKRNRGGEGRKRMERLEEKMNQMQETLTAIQQQLQMQMIKQN